jgi:hypothetical protein
MLRIGLMLLLVACVPAMAFDTTQLGQGKSLPLDELDIVSKTPRLKDEVDKALANVKKKPEEIICYGERFPGQWEHLGGFRVAPYSCDFGSKELEITAKVRLTSGSGKEFKTINSNAMKNASRILETNPKWKWKSKP